MATSPFPAVCSACHAPLAPGAKFCGGCGRISGAGPMPPGGGYAPPPAPPSWGAMPGAGYDTVTVAGSPDQAMPRLAAALSQVGAQTIGQIPGGIRFRHGIYGARMNGEATIVPDGLGNSVITIGVQFDKGSFWVFGGVGLALNVLFVTVAPILLLPVIGGMAALYAHMQGGGREKVRGRILAAVRQAMAVPSPVPAGGYHAPPPPMPSAPPPSPPAGASTTDRLRELAARRDRGMLSPEEFDRAKAAILNQLH